MGHDPLSLRCGVGSSRGDGIGRQGGVFFRCSFWTVASDVMSLPLQLEPGVQSFRGQGTLQLRYCAIWGLHTTPRRRCRFQKTTVDAFRTALQSECVEATWSLLGVHEAVDH